MSDDIGWLLDELSWRAKQDGWWSSAGAARLRLLGIEVVRLPFHTPNGLIAELSPIPVARIKRP